MLKWFLLAGGLFAGGIWLAHADDGTGLGSQLRAVLSQAGTGTPLTTDWVKLLRGQNGDPVYVTVGSLYDVPAFTIATLPACTANTGMIAYVTNGVASPTYLLAVSTTGAANQLVWCNGTAWAYH